MSGKVAQSRGVGWTSLIVAILFLGGIQLFSIGVVGEYIARIYDEVRQRPLFVVNDYLGFEHLPKADVSVENIPGQSI